MANRITGVVAAIALLLCANVQAQTKSTAAASSKDKAEAKAHYDQGTVRYKLDEWSQAIDEFRAAYRMYPDPNFLYNIAQCYRKMGNAPEALTFYKKYIRERPDAPNRAEVEKRIEELEAAQLQPKAAEPAGPITPPPAAPSAIPQTTAVEPQVPLAVTEGQPTRTGGSGLKTAGIVVAGVGGAALIAGVLLNVKANSMTSDMNKVDGYTDSKESDRKTYAALAWTGYGVGAACIAGGAVLYYLGLRGSNASSSVAFVPVISAGQTGAVLQGSF